jgi:hypothetical protein
MRLLRRLLGESRQGSPRHRREQKPGVAIPNFVNAGSHQHQELQPWSRPLTCAIAWTHLNDSKKMRPFASTLP